MTDPVEAHQRLAAWLATGVGAQVLVQRGELNIERVDHPKRDPKGLSRLGRESGGVGFLEGDEAGGELEQGEVVVVFLGPADEDGAVAFQPRVAGLHHPAVCAPAGRASLSAISSPRVRMWGVNPRSVASSCTEGAS